MKKLLLTTAIVGAATFAVAAPAKADIQLGLGGHFKGYVTWQNQDEAAPTATASAPNARSVDIIRDTEIHFTGETTLDNGLTVGFHAEESADAAEFTTQESYAYFAGNWGRVNFGAEDGAVYLLQVAAPAADTNYDGIRQQVNPFNAALAPAPLAAALATRINTTRIDYAQDNSGYADKITYITPVFAGFQAGVSYTPEVGALGSPLNLNGSPSRSFGVSNASVGAFGTAMEASARYEGQFNAVRVTFGGGYTQVQLDAPTAAGGDDDQAWNVGTNLGFGPFNVGAAYKRDNRALTGSRDDNTWVVGADYTTGPFVLGASYYDENMDDYNGLAAGTGDLSIKRYAGGVTYTYGPGMSFRGSVEHVKYDVDASGAAAATSPDGTSVLLGTQINF